VSGVGGSGRAASPNDEPRWSALEVALFVGLALTALGVAAFLLVSPGVYLGDDAFILMTYGRNLAGGLGPVFNVGERVWGYTSPLQVAALAAVHLAAPGNAIQLAAALSALELGVAALLLSLLLRRSGGPFVYPAALLLLLHPALSLFHGLESTLMVGLQCLVLALLAAGLPAAAAGAAALACLARPDTLLFALPLALLDRRLRTMRPVAAFVVPGLAWLLFSALYHGAVVPNTLGAKSGLEGFAAFWLDAARWITDPALSGQEGSAGALSRIALLLANWSLLSTGALRRSLHGRCLLFALCVHPWLLVSAYAAIGPPTIYKWEIYSAHFFFVAGAALGAAHLAHRAFGLAHRARTAGPARPVAAALVTAALTITALHVRLPQLLHKLGDVQSSFYVGARFESYRGIALWFDHHVRGSAPALAHYEVGTLGYFTRRVRIVDLGGLVTERPAALSGQDLVAAIVAAEAPSHLLRPWQPEAGELHFEGAGAYRPTHTFPALGYTPFTLYRRAAYRSGER
jgi:hypothetical protein